MEDRNMVERRERKGKREERETERTESERNTMMKKDNIKRE